MSFPNQPGNDLQGMIASSQYQVASPADVSSGVNLGFVGETPPPGVVSTPDAQTAVVQQGGQPGVTPGTVAPQQPSVHPLEAENQRLRRDAYIMAQQKIEAEERAFEASIAHLSEYEQEFERVKREKDQYAEVNNYLNTRMSNDARQAQNRQQVVAKNLWGLLHAHQNGLDYNDPVVRGYLDAAANPSDMSARAQSLSQRMGMAAIQQGQQKVNDGTFAVGGNNGASVPAAMPKQYSGDLDALIGATQYQVVMG